MVSRGLRPGPQKSARTGRYPGVKEINVPIIGRVACSGYPIVLRQERKKEDAYVGPVVFWLILDDFPRLAVGLVARFLGEPCDMQSRNAGHCSLFSFIHIV